MKAVLQRVREAQVSVEGETIASIGAGIVAFVAAMRGDSAREAEWLAGKLVEFRVFEDSQQKMNRSILETRGSLLLVSQFTLAADGTKGRRPSFDLAAPPDDARALLELLRSRVESRGVPVACGRFGAAMVVTLANDGPATFILESPAI
jgi:D-tyrosyl-tRNA(Tyr) deacylase